MYGVIGALRTVAIGFRAGAQRFMLSFSNEMEAARLRSEDLAHLATRGDRPFLGCTPSPPESTPWPGPRVNPPAKARHGDGGD